ncbi:MAG: hypothetical protein IJT91_04125, partial [Clostridia bacterium]|nr:hypothetical protein [Clostridia bacterium]
VKSNADAFGEMKSTHRRRGDFTARRAISPPQAISPTLQGWISLPTVLWDSRLKALFFGIIDLMKNNLTGTYYRTKEREIQVHLDIFSAQKRQTFKMRGRTVL